MDETARQDRKRDRTRAAGERIYRINLVGPITGGIGRWLFGVPTDAQLHERRDRDHRFVTPDAHVLLKHRPASKGPASRGDLLEVVRKRVAADASLPFTADEIADLLTDLFRIADRWHWHQLDGRRPDEAAE